MSKRRSVTAVTSRDLRSLSIEATLGLLFAAAFTVLPLRAVLVPSEVDMLTLVDDLLGAELMLLLTVGVAAYWRHLRQHPTPASREDAPS